MDGHQSLTSPDRASNSSSRSNGSAVSPINGGGAVLTPAPDSIVSQLPVRSASTYHPSQQQMRQQTQQRPHPDRGTGNVIVGQSMMTNPGAPESVRGFPPADHRNTNSMPNRSFSMRHAAQGLQPPPFIAGPLPDRVAHLRGAHPKPSRSQVQQGPTASSSRSQSQQGPTASSSNPSMESTHQALIDEISRIHSRLYGLSQGTLQRTDLPKSFMDGFQVDCKQLASGLFSLANKTKDLGKQIQNLEQDYNDAKNAMGSMGTRNLDLDRERQFMEQYREEITQELRNATEALENEAIKNKKLQAMLGEAQLTIAENEETIGTLNDNVRHLKEQVEAKRNLWMEVHKEPKERAWALSQSGHSHKSASTLGKDRSAPSDNPYTGMWRPRMGAPGMKSSQQFDSQRSISVGQRTSQLELAPTLHRVPTSAARGTQFGPSAMSSLSDIRSKSLLASGTNYQMDVARRGDPAAYRGEEGNHQQVVMFDPRHSGTFPIRTEAGSPPKRLLKTDPKVMGQEIQDLWTMLMGFCQSHAGRLSKMDVAAHLQNHEPQMWRKLSRCSYADKRQGEALAYSILKDPVNRPFLTHRFIAQTIVETAFGISPYIGFHKTTDEALREIEAMLKDTSNPQDRVELLRRQMRVVHDIRAHRMWEEYRRTHLKELVAEVKTATWNLILDDMPTKTREQANSDLFSIAEVAMDVAEKVMLSEHDFQFTWYDAGEKYTEAIHHAINHPVPIAELVAENWRIQVGITPGITARALSGMNIVPQRVLRAKCLVMP